MVGGDKSRVVNFGSSSFMKAFVGFAALVFAFCTGSMLLLNTSDTIFLDAPQKIPQFKHLDTGCSVKLNRHYPISSVFTKSFPPSLHVFDSQSCKTEFPSTAHNKSVKGEWLQCLPEKAWVPAKLRGATIQNTTSQWTDRRRQTKRFEPRSWLNVYHGGKSPANLVVQGNAVLAALGLTELVMRIEADIASCRQWHKKDVEAACSRPDPVVFSANESENVVLVELGSANANLLHSFCPPDPLRRMRCYGVELIPQLAEDAISYQTHINVESGIKSSLRDSSATHVLIHGVLPIISIRNGCDSIVEGLRLLVPGGAMLIVMLHTGLKAPWPTRHHPFFFKSHARTNSTGPSASSILPFCSIHVQMKLDELVDSVEFMWNAREFLFYEPNYKQTGVYAVRLTRSSRKMEQQGNGRMHEETPRSLERVNYKNLCVNPWELVPIKEAQLNWAKVVIDMKAHFVRKKVKRGVYVWVERNKR